VALLQLGSAVALERIADLDIDLARRRRTSGDASELLDTPEQGMVIGAAG